MQESVLDFVLCVQNVDSIFLQLQCLQQATMDYNKHISS